MQLLWAGVLEKDSDFKLGDLVCTSSYDYNVFSTVSVIWKSQSTFLQLCHIREPVPSDIISLL